MGYSGQDARSGIALLSGENYNELFTDNLRKQAYQDIIDGTTYSLPELRRLHDKFDSYQARVLRGQVACRQVISTIPESISDIPAVKTTSGGLIVNYDGIHQYYQDALSQGKTDIANDIGRVLGFEDYFFVGDNK